MYQFKNNQLVFYGFEKGIADSPHTGISDMRNVDIIASPGEAQVGYATQAMNVPPSVNALAFSVNATNDTFTVSSTANWYEGMAITLNTLTGGTGLSSGRVYWVANITPTTFKVYTVPAQYAMPAPVDVTTNGTGTLSTFTMGEPLRQTIDYSGSGIFIQGLPVPMQFFIDDAGRVWWVNNFSSAGQGVPTNNLIYTGNTNLSLAFGQGIVTYKGYLFAFRLNTIDYIKTSYLLDPAGDIGGTSGWVYNWQNTKSTPNHSSLVGQDDIIYYLNFDVLGSISTVAGQSFNPTNNATYNNNQNALNFPANDVPNSLGELGVKLLIGGVRNYVYPWDRVSPSFDLPVILPENVTYKIVTGANQAYLFSGTRGRIYVTNGSSASLYQKIPDNIVNGKEAFFTWGDAFTWKNQLSFSFTATSNTGAAYNSTGGIWSIDLSSNALRMSNKLSYGTYAGRTLMMMPNVLTQSPAGTAIIAGWSNGGVNGVDIGTSTPYTDYSAYIDTELVPTATFTEKWTPRTVEWKTAKKLVANESVRLSYRLNLTDPFTVVSTSTVTGKVSDQQPPNFQNSEWVQFRIELKSTATNPSYVPLTEVRISS